MIRKIKKWWRDRCEIAELKRRIEGMGMSWELARFWLRANNEHLGETPIKAVKKGRLEEVIVVAAAFCNGSTPDPLDLGRALMDYEGEQAPFCTPGHCVQCCYDMALSCSCPCHTPDGVNEIRRRPPGPPPPGPPEPPVPPMHRPVS